MPRTSTTRVLCAVLLLCARTLAQQPASPSPPSEDPRAREFKAALADYDAGRFAQAATALEHLEKEAPSSFDVHELLGMSYGAQSLDAKAVQQLRRAADLKPASLSAHTNLATGLVHTGDVTGAEQQCRLALALNPADYNANHTLAQLYLRRDQVDAALPYLQAAQRARPAAPDNGYDLALALVMKQQYAPARELLHTLQADHDSADLHRLTGRVDEAEGHYLEAANEYATAAHLDPTEENLFVWASELLSHRAYPAAIEVFKSATQRFPRAPRLWTGLGMAYYSRGEYADSITALLTAADLKPDDPRCYVFLSKAFLSSPTQAEEVIARFRNYATLEPNNALAQYYYAVGLWKGRRLETPDIDYKTVEALLRKSIALDAKNPEVHLQLGILYNDEQQYAQSLPQYQQALELDPKLADAHFRLARYYLHVGEKAKAEAELDTFRKLQAEHQATVDKERAEVQQFVVSSTPTPTSPSK